MKRTLSAAVLTVALGIATFANSQRSNAATTLRDLSTVGGHVAADIDIAETEAGFPALAYYNPGTADLYYVRCLSADCGALVRQPVDSAGDVGQEPSLLVGENGIPIIAYRDATPSGPFTSRLKVAHCLDVTCTTKTLSYPDTGTSDSITNAGHGIDMAAYGPGVVITHGSAGGESGVRMVFCDEDSCLESRQVDPVAGRDTSIAINPGTGFLAVTHVSPSAVIRMVLCNNANCSSRTQRIFTGTNAEDPSLTIGLDLIPMIAYHDLDADHLGLIRCANTTCDSTIPTILDNVDVTGRNPVMLSRIDGGSSTPVIVYTDGYTGVAGAHTGDVRLFACGNAACDTGNTIHLVDPSEDGVGAFLAMRINDDGLPRIATIRSENDTGTTTNNIRMLICDTPACVDAPPGPFIHSVEPKRSMEGDPVPALVVRGHGFGTDAQIRFAGINHFSGPIGGNEDALVTVPDTNLLTFGFKEVEVIADGGGTSQAAGFTVLGQSTDVTCNGETSAADALTVMYELAGLSLQREECPFDPTQDETLTIHDAVFILRVVAGLATPLPVEPDPIF